TKYLELFDINDDQNAWFDKIKSIADALGYASDMKAYKADPTAFRGSVADISMFLRVAVTGKLNSPDMFTVMQILGAEKVKTRINNMINSL
ncbi:MAG: glutamate--tRNA ligase, partial [Clostridia bacterium]|nr:glutamate--tRNA ligase [Clostridia bacterium]